ncbi:MAG TPA: ribonuclease HII [Candidatus Nanoarchaeia archaeon]|nr:ribonuclease HII [Candidatus Nanoarchaeia archaeon]
MLICGIDEARRGPIIGPMVMCGAMMEEKDLPKLIALKPKDSKLMTKEEREKLYPKLLSVLKYYHVLIIQPDEIDKAVKGTDGLNLNRLEAHKQADILNEFNPNQAIIDCPSNNIDSYRIYLKKLLKNKQVDLILEHKAERYPLVAAASIIAKVTGDREIEITKKELGIDFGSGYMSDPKTVAFLQKNFEKYPELFRKSWFPYQDLVNKKFQSNLSDFGQFLKDEKKHKGHTLEDLKKLEDFGYKFEKPKSQHELAVMKGPCTIILYRNGKLLIQGKQEVKQSVQKLLDFS